jgi:hypothetical protein
MIDIIGEGLLPGITVFVDKFQTTLGILDTDA